jgi:OOP family OmpA-OmpF porin
MKVRLQKLRLVVAASAVAITAGVYAAEGSDVLYVQDGFGGPVKDPFGKCVLSLGGSRVPGCVEEVAVIPPPTPVHETMTVGADTFFDFDKYNLKPAGIAKLDELAAKLRQLGPAVTSVSVTGHTDSVGTEAYNLKLSQRRAQAVVDYLVQQGVNPNLIRAQGVGMSQPIASNATPAGRAQNRRVEITVDSMQPSRG